MSEKTAIEYILDTLEEKERFVIENYYGVGNAEKRIACYSDIEKMCGIRRNKANILHQRALRKMRAQRLLQLTRSINHPELYFDIFGESKECVHMKIYFESYFNNIEISNREMAIQMNNLSTEMYNMEVKFQNFIKNISNVLQGSELYKFLNEVNRSSQNVGIEMSSVCCAAESVKGACSSLVATFNKLLDKVENEPK